MCTRLVLKSAIPNCFQSLSNKPGEWNIKFPVCFHVQESHLLWVDSRDDSAQCGDEPGADLGIVAACQESMGQITNVLSVAQSRQKTVHTLLSG